MTVIQKANRLSIVRLGQVLYKMMLWKQYDIGKIHLLNGKEKNPHYLTRLCYTDQRTENKQLMTTLCSHMWP